MRLLLAGYLSAQTVYKSITTITTPTNPRSKEADTAMGSGGSGDIRHLRYPLLYQYQLRLTSPRLRPL